MEMRGILVWFCLNAFSGLTSESWSGCEEVREVFRVRQIGPAKSVPETPRTGSDLQVCRSRNLTCCTRKMEERYQVAARRDFQNLLQKSFSSLKLLLSHNVGVFQEAVDVLVRQAQNHTVAVLLSSYGDLAERASAPVADFFADVGLFVLGAELDLEEVVQRFFHALFPPVFELLVDPRLPRPDPAYIECARAMATGSRAPYGPAPGLLVARVGGASLPARLFLQALHLGVEVVNTTEHLPLGRECRRALLKMAYCPQCQGAGRQDSRPCTGYCLNVLRGCLASLAEVDTPWREFVRSLEGVASRPGPDLEQALADTPSLVRDAVAHAHASAPWLSAQMRKACGQPSRELAHSSIVQQGSGVHDLPLRTSAPHMDDTIDSRRRELLRGLRVYRTFYGGLVDQLCVSELTTADSVTCWNGADVVRSYTQRVVGSGVKAQNGNPEVRVKEVDPVINQVIDKLKHINQLLQGRTIPKLGTLDQIEVGSGDTESPSSGDCDDEDGCWGSGNGVVQGSAARTPKLAPEQSSDRRSQKPGARDPSPASLAPPTIVRPGPLVMLATATLVLLSG